MRKLPLGVAISMIVHAVVLAWVAARWHGRTPAKPATPPETVVEIVDVARPPTPPDQPPVEVVLLDEPVITAPPAPAATAPAPPAPAAPSPAPAVATITTSPPSSAAAKIETETARGSAAPPPDDGAAEPSHGNLLAMRRSAPTTPTLRAELPAGQWDAYDHVPRGTAPEVEIHTGQLKNRAGGDKTSDQGPFVATVKPDGTVKLADAANLSVHLAVPTPGVIASGLQAWYYNPNKDLGAGGERDGTGESNSPLAKSFQVTSGSSTNPGGEGQPQAHEPTLIVPIIGGHFDVTDALMRSHGIDPYASKKLKFLDSTRDERVQIGNKHRAEQLAQVAPLMQRNLVTLWASQRDPAARKRALFELWDECTETGDPAAVTAGQAARRLVIGFIRGHLPAGSADAFTADEIAALAKTQQSKTAFQPYEP
jgi:hypothetical protein